MNGRLVIGQFVPGDTQIHRLDPRVKILIAMAYMAALFIGESWGALAILGMSALVVTASARTPVRSLLRGLAPLAWVIPFTVIANALAPGSNQLVLGWVSFSVEGLMRGLFLASRIVLLIVGTSVVTLTTSPVALSDAAASLMRPLQYVRVPVDDVAMMLSIALRFIPVIAEEADQVVTAQAARGARFGEGGPITRAKAWGPVLVPLFVRMFRRAEDLAWAMESRCYSGRGRTRLNPLKMRWSDVAALAFAVAGLSVVTVLSMRGML